MRRRRGSSPWTVARCLPELLPHEILRSRLVTTRGRPRPPSSRPGEILMNMLVKSALILTAFAPLATGCIFVGDDDDTTSGKATVQASWHLFDDGTAATCPPGGKITI